MYVHMYMYVYIRYVRRQERDLDMIQSTYWLRELRAMVLCETAIYYYLWFMVRTVFGDSPGMNAKPNQNIDDKARTHRQNDHKQLSHSIASS
jgi:hypothetical protein